ncbi:hypothetical protein D5b_00262 [Faustovirus]|nr:hypothetical protein D5b_00262 [Faustovirus]AMN84652.1 hypothetical protein D6_00249 [Faustovirus]AMP44214.1 hypothetical protein PRJ_Dakar_00258 [Faustovirus]
MDINAIITPSVGSKRPIAALDLPIETQQDAIIDLNAPSEPTLEPPRKRAKVAKPPNPNILKTKIRDMKGAVLVVFCRNRNKHYPMVYERNEEYKILVYDIENKQIYETTHKNHKPDPKYPDDDKRTLQLTVDEVLSNDLKLKLVDESKNDFSFSIMLYEHYVGYLYKNGERCMYSYSDLIKKQYDCAIEYFVNGYWSITKTSKITIKNTNDYALHILAKYKKMCEVQKETQKVLNFKL